jgi:hypothetical protein
MQKDIQEVYDRTQGVDAKLAEMNTTSATVSEDALAYKAELMRKKREKEGHLDINTTINETTTKNNIAEENN